MSLGFSLLLLIGFVLLLSFMHVLEELAIERRSAPRGMQKRPRSDDTITYSGNG